MYVHGERGGGGQVGSAPACYGSTRSLNSDIPQQSYMGDISKGMANTLEPATKKVPVQDKTLLAAQTKLGLFVVTFVFHWVPFSNFVAVSVLGFLTFLIGWRCPNCFKWYNDEFRFSYFKGH
jgi:hypothetical protein